MPLQAYASVYGGQNLSLGSQGVAVSQLQNDLTKQGFSTYGVDGFFGQNTKNAVMRFQQVKGLMVDGIAGVQTKRALQEDMLKNSSNQVLRLGDSGPLVSELQRNLSNLGFNTYGVDGIFGSNTYNAVTSFQRAQGISVDGIVGAQSNTALRFALIANKTSNSSTPVSRGASTIDVKKYPKLSKVNGVFGQFRYRDIGGGRIEIEPNWVAGNIVTINLPGLNRQVQVHSLAKDNFIKAFTIIQNESVIINGKRVALLSLIKTMDGTFVPRHVGWDNSRALSNHSWGTAIDINAAGHFRYVNPVTEANNQNLIIWEKAFKPAGFSWGNSFNDAMHYELKR